MIRILKYLAPILIFSHYLFLLWGNNNSDLAEKLQALEKKLLPLQDQMQQVKTLSGKLHQLTTETRPNTVESLGPEISEAPQLSISLAALKDSEAQNIERLVLSESMDTLSDEMRRQIYSLSRLVDYFENQKELRVVLPSICPVKGRLSSPFGTRVDPYTGAPTMHSGTDFAAPEGTPVFAPAYGRVVFVGNDAGYGNLVVIDHGLGFQTQFGHLKESHVEIGAIVERGQTIARVGSTGRSTGPHLHYEVRKFGIPVNPMQFMVDG